MASVAFALTNGHDHRQAGLAGEPVVEPPHGSSIPSRARRDRRLHRLELGLQSGLALAQEADPRLVSADVLLQLLLRRAANFRLASSIAYITSSSSFLQRADGGLRMPDFHAQAPGIRRSSAPGSAGSGTGPSDRPSRRSRFPSSSSSIPAAAVRHGRLPPRACSPAILCSTAATSRGIARNWLSWASRFWSRSCRMRSFSIVGVGMCAHCAACRRLGQMKDSRARENLRCNTSRPDRSRTSMSSV